MFQSELLNDGFILMCYGMAVVFVFLTLLYLSTLLMSYLVRNYFPAASAGVHPEAGQQAPVVEEHVSAIIAAVKLHREKSRRP